MGDSACDGANNNPSYNFDGGDCCVPAKQKKGKDKKWCKGNNCLCKTMKVDLKVRTCSKYFTIRFRTLIIDMQ